MNIEVPGGALLVIPFDVKSIGVDNKALANVVRAVDVQNDLQIEIVAPEHVELNSSPAYIEQLLEIVRTRDAAADLGVGRKCVFLSKRHSYFSVFLGCRSQLDKKEGIHGLRRHRMDAAPALAASTGFNELWKARGDLHTLRTHFRLDTPGAAARDGPRGASTTSSARIPHNSRCGRKRGHNDRHW